MSRAQRLASNTLTTMGARALAFALMIVSMKVLAVCHGESRYGVFLLALSLLSNLQVFTLGVPSALVRFVARSRGEGDEAALAGFVRASFRFYVAVGLAVALVLAALATVGLGLFRVDEADRSAARAVLLLASAWTLLSFPLQVYGQVLAGLQEFGRLNRAIALQAALANAGYLAVGLGGLPVWGAVVAMAASQSVMFALNIADVRRLLPALDWWRAAPRSGLVRELFGFSAAMFLLGVAGKVFYEIDTLVLSGFVSTAAVTYYAFVAYPLMAVREANGWLTQAMMPSISEAMAAGDSGFVEALVERGSRIALLFTASLAAVACAAMRQFLAAWMGEEYAALTPIGQALLASYALSAAFAVAGQALVATGRESLPLRVALVSASANLVLSVWLVRGHGVWGVALGTVLATVLAVPMACWWFLPALGVRRWHFVLRTMAPVYAVTGAMGAACWWGAGAIFPDRPGLLGVAAYSSASVAATLAAGYALVLPREDRDRLRDLVLRRG